MRFPRALIAALVAVVLPGTAAAASLVVEGAPAGWKVVGAPTGVGTQGYWDRQSYDTAGTLGTGACSAASLVRGGLCDWIPRHLNGDPPIGLPHAAKPGVPVEYLGVLGQSDDAPLNFYLTGGFEFDWTVLFQLSAWDDSVEFGWYQRDDPASRTPIIGPGGPYTNNDGQPGQAGSATIPNTEFGFYYRNTRYGAAIGDPAGDVFFFTQSKFNTLGNYFAYFSDPGFGSPKPGPDDELAFRQVFDPPAFQQFIVFRQGHRYWLGLEDQFGRPTGVSCDDWHAQPCSDYDFNDLIFSFKDKAIPEPATLALMSIGVAGALAARRRRRR